MPYVMLLRVSFEQLCTVKNGKSMDEIKGLDGKNNRFQFSLKSVLKFMTIVCICLALVPPRLMLAVLPVLVSVSIIYALLKLVDKLIISQESQSPSNSVGSCLLVSVSIWTIAFVLFLTLVRVPGGYGTVQFTVGNNLARFVFGLRFGTVFVLAAAPIATIVIGSLRHKAGAPIRKGWVVAAIVFYAAAWATVAHNVGFVPMA